MFRALFITLIAIQVVIVTSLAQRTHNQRTVYPNEGMSSPLPPSEDPFYHPNNATWRFSLPGTILKHRDITNTGIGNITGAAKIKKAFQLLYRTTDVHGAPSYTVTTVIVPFFADLSKHISYQVITDSPARDCAPSYGLQLGSSSHASEAQTEVAAITRFLNQGIIVSIPDYEGPQAAFTVGPESAMGVLDSIRAVLKSSLLTGISPSAPTTLIGYSGGGLASEWAAEFHQKYAPELKIIGAAIGGLPVNLTKTISAVNGAQLAGLIPASLLGVAARFPKMERYINEHLLDNYKSQFHIPLSQCQYDITNTSYGYGPTLAFQNISSWFSSKKGLESDLRPLLSHFGVMGLHGTPRFPLYVWKSTTDEVVPDISETDALVEKYCAMGTSVQYIRFEGATHIDTFQLGFDGAVDFIGELFKGVIYKGCSTVNQLSGHS